MIVLPIWQRPDSHCQWPVCRYSWNCLNEQVTRWKSLEGNLIMKVSLEEARLLWLWQVKLVYQKICLPWSLWWLGMNWKEGHRRTYSRRTRLTTNELRVAVPQLKRKQRLGCEISEPTKSIAPVTIFPRNRLQEKLQKASSQRLCVTEQQTFSNFAGNVFLVIGIRGLRSRLGDQATSAREPSSSADSRDQIRKINN